MGGLSEPSKMPGFGHSTSARDCIAGSKLRLVKGSTCEDCYAMGGHYNYPVVQNALKKRLVLLKDPLWVEAMTRALANEEWFRWHDSGDLQGVWHLDNIAAVCRATPHVKHWLPTREYTFVRDWLRNNVCPENLCIRLSEHMVNQIGPAQKLAVKYNVTSSAVEYKTDLVGSHCPALHQGNVCGSCRNCWDKNVPLVIYTKH